MVLRPTRSTLFPYTTLFRSCETYEQSSGPARAQATPRSSFRTDDQPPVGVPALLEPARGRRRPHDFLPGAGGAVPPERDRKSTRLNSSHANISYAVFCLKKK